ncbi:hypothetical protein [Bdellovibrio sp. NC01]|uniref:hypothetical protein n=1 Tax=Bdellovibrio sp. NC01 TaxID=2220073 RepID=UPI001156D679|nr:hypothetical protein [Bdellovibrio sp. NC01]QDK37170.1 hypothetical protein DOE51_05985 [Bdellovibrio sp. NC01]
MNFRIVLVLLMVLPLQAHALEGTYKVGDKLLGVDDRERIRMNEEANKSGLYKDKLPTTPAEQTPAGNQGSGAQSAPQNTSNQQVDNSGGGTTPQQQAAPEYYNNADGVTKTHIESGEIVLRDDGGGPRTSSNPQPPQQDASAAPQQREPSAQQMEGQNTEAATPEVAAEAPAASDKTNVDVKQADGEVKKEAAARDGSAHNQIMQATTSLMGLPARAASVGLHFPGEAKLKSVQAAYKKAYESCGVDKPRATFFCMEETNPNIQSTLQTVNMIMAGASAIAVKDACSNMAKALQVAQTGLTAYTTACTILKVKCESSCGSSLKALQGIQEAVSGAATCEFVTTVDQQLSCQAYQKEYVGLVKQTMMGLKKEMGIESQGSTAQYNKTCAVDYMKSLASAGLGIMQIVNSAKQANQCEDKSSGTSTAGSSSAAGSATAATTTSAATSTQATGTAEDLAAARGISTTPTSSLQTIEAVQATDPKMTKGPQVTAPSEPVKTKEQLEAENPYRAYLPGGSKAMKTARDPAAEEFALWRKEVTPANGKTNFTKMQENFTSQRKTLFDAD